MRPKFTTNLSSNISNGSSNEGHVLRSSNEQIVSSTKAMHDLFEKMRW